MRTCLAGPIVCGTLVVIAISIQIPLVMGWGAGKQSKPLVECFKTSAQFRAELAKRSSIFDADMARMKILEEQRHRISANPWTAETDSALERIQNEYLAILNEPIPPLPDVMIVSDACIGRQV